MSAPRFNLKEFIEGVSAGLQGASDVLSLGQLLAANRGRLGEALAQGSITEARAIVKQMCTDHPAIAGVVNYVMTQDVNSAINAIELYDPQLAAQLRQNQANFARLQTQWAGGAEGRARACGCDCVDWSASLKVAFCPCPCHQ